MRKTIDRNTENTPQALHKREESTVYRIRDSSNGHAVVDFYDFDAMIPYLRWALDDGLADYEEPPIVEEWWVDRDYTEPVHVYLIREALERGDTA